MSLNKTLPLWLTFTLFIVSLIITALLLIPSIVYKAIKVIRKESSLSDWLFRMAKSQDQLWNVMSDDLFNSMLIKDDTVSFGDEDEFVSSVLGKNYLINNLTTLGTWLKKILDFIEKDHVVKWIELDEGK